MKLLDAETVWAFLSGSDEERFLSDILFGVKCLLYRNFPKENILLFIDQLSESNFISAYGFPEDIAISPTLELNAKLAAKPLKKLVIVVTGHGVLRGIAASPDIQPYHLLSVMRGLPALEAAVVVLGQCFAGTFNFLEARSKDAAGKVMYPEICFMGATDLTYSVSLPVDLTNSPIAEHIGFPLQWSANLFLMFFMIQVADPIDFDGDQRFSVLDAYKASGIGTNGELLHIKQMAFQSLQKSIVDSTVGQFSQPDIAQQLMDRARQDLASASTTILMNQNPWILHANLARQLEL